MAQRRMFSKTITSSGKFLKMPQSSRLLYYDLGMQADDDGFAEWFTVMKMTGAAEQDLSVLSSNGFVKVFDENVLVIKDWKENNYIQKDRYTASKYLNVYDMDTECIQSVNTGKVRIGKSKDRLIPETSSDNPPKDIFNYQTTITRWLTGKDEAYRLIAQMFQYKNLKFETAAQMQAAARRHLKAAHLILPFSQEQRDTALSRMLENKALGNEWTLDTLYKYLTK